MTCYSMTSPRFPRLRLRRSVHVMYDGLSSTLCHRRCILIQRESEQCKKNVGWPRLPHVPAQIATRPRGAQGEKEVRAIQQPPVFRVTNLPCCLSDSHLVIFIPIPLCIHSSTSTPTANLTARNRPRLYEREQRIVFG